MFKSFADQRCLSFECELSLSNTSGTTSIGATRVAGLSSSETVLFNFQSGKVIDSTNNFIYSYSANENLKISGNICSGLFGYYINDEPVKLRDRLCQSCFTTTNLENFFISTTGVSIDFSLKINVDTKPSYSIEFPFSPYLTGSDISGYLLNESQESWRRFKVFSGDSVFLNNSSYKLDPKLTGVKINPGSSGLFVLKYDGLDNRFNVDETGKVSDLSGVVYLNSDFGLIEQSVSVPLFKSPSYSIDFSEAFTGFSNPTGFLWSHVLSRQACSGALYQVVVKKGFWIDQLPLSSLVRAETGQFVNGKPLTGVGVFYDGLLDQYRSTGFIPSSGCFDGSSFEIDHSVYYNFINEQNKNEIILSVSGINESFYSEKRF